MKKIIIVGIVLVSCLTTGCVPQESPSLPTNSKPSSESESFVRYRNSTKPTQQAPKQPEPDTELQESFRVNVKLCSSKLKVVRNVLSDLSKKLKSPELKVASGNQATFIELVNEVVELQGLATSMESQLTKWEQSRTMAADDAKQWNFDRYNAVLDKLASSVETLRKKVDDFCTAKQEPAPQPPAPVAAVPVPVPAPPVQPAPKPSTPTYQRWVNYPLNCGYVFPELLVPMDSNEAYYVRCPRCGQMVKVK